MFEVTISLMQLLSSFRESQREDIKEMLETYKVNLTKYYKVVEK